MTTARQDAELLLCSILKKDRAWLFTHSDEPLDSGNEPLFSNAIERRSRREPLQYIVGNQEFWGLDFSVTPEVLIPRPETELLVESALKILKNVPHCSVIDVCTGSGCVAVSLAHELPGSRIFALDTSGRALDVARQNARKHAVTERIRFLEGDLFKPLEELDLRATFDVITANPPYIPSGDLPALQPEVRDYEPQVALIAGPRGTEIHERIIHEARHFLKHGGSLIMEMGLGQADALVRIVAESGSYGDPEVLKDLAGIDRVFIARRR